MREATHQRTAVVWLHLQEVPSSQIHKNRVTSCHQRQEGGSFSPGGWMSPGGEWWWDSQVALVVNNLPAKAGDIRDSGSIPGKIPLMRKWLSTPVFLPREPPWTEGPGGLQTKGLQRVGHNWSDLLSLFNFMHWRRKWQPTPGKCSCLENPRDGEARWAAVYGVIQSRTRLKWLSSSRSNLAPCNVNILNTHYCTLKMVEVVNFIMIFKKIKD